MRAPWLVIAFIVCIMATVIVVILPNSNQGDALHAFEALDLVLGGAIGGVHLPISSGNSNA